MQNPMAIVRCVFHKKIKSCVSFVFQCLDDEYLSQALKVMNCSPPYLTNKQQLWCNKNIDIKDMNVQNFLWKLGGGVLDDGNCLPPCKKTKYESILHNFNIFKCISC